jgi:hypothetical protein
MAVNDPTTSVAETRYAESEEGSSARSGSIPDLISVPRYGFIVVR